jgi:predicted lipid-binding transport protein (Tim44 family)
MRLIDMRYFFLALIVIFTSFALMTDDAEAKRFGGGSSLGKQRFNYSRQAAPQPPAAPAQQAMPNRPGQRMGGWFGPLAGLMAGGLLASLFLGHPFQGLQAMDLMILAALGIGAFLLLRNRRPRPAYPAAGHGYSRTGLDTGETALQLPDAGSRHQEAASAINRPDWFDEESFLRAAKTHFIRLQTAWDAGDMKDISEYTTPQLFAELTLERERLGLAKHFTEVVQLKAELLDLVTEGETIIASVRFSGLIREEESAVGEPFSEVWHVERALNEPNADWYVAGIQQE